MTRFGIFEPRAALAQLGEHLICNQAVSGSSPLGGSKFAPTRIGKKQRVTISCRNPFCVKNVRDNPRQRERLTHASRRVSRLFL